MFNFCGGADVTVGVALFYFSTKLPPVTLREASPGTQSDDNNTNIASEQGAPLGTEQGAQRRSQRTSNPPQRLQPSHGGKLYYSLSETQFFTYNANSHAVKHLQRSESQRISMIHKAMDIIFTMTKEKANKLAPSPQMTATKGIQKYGEVAVAAMMKEFKQLVNGAFPGKPVVEGINHKDLTDSDKKAALDAINLIKIKKNGTAKGQTCANGSREKYYLKPDEQIASPTCSLEAIISTLLMDIYEERDVVIYVIPGAYLHAHMPSEHRITLKLRGQFVDIMCQVNPEFKTNILIENGEKVLYLRVLRALYGCICSAMLWYNLYVETLEKEGYKVNPYNRCVANKVINGSQCTIVWYVDDNKISNKDKDVVTKEMEMISKHFGDLSITRGNT